MFNSGEEFMSDEEIAARLQKTRDEYDLKLQTEMDKGLGMFKTIGSVFDDLFNFDFMGMIKDIPGVSTVLGFLGLGGDKSLDDSIKDKEDYISSLKKDVANDGFFESKSNREKDKLALAEAMKELEDMRAEQAGNVTVVNNNNVVNANTNTSNNQTTTVPLRDTTPPAGTLTPAFADF
jgi:hypothetical protein